MLARPRVCAVGRMAVVQRAVVYVCGKSAAGTGCFVISDELRHKRGNATGWYAWKYLLEASGSSRLAPMLMVNVKACLPIFRLQ